MTLKMRTFLWSAAMVCLGGALKALFIFGAAAAPLVAAVLFAGIVGGSYVKQKKPPELPDTYWPPGPIFSDVWADCERLAEKMLAAEAAPQLRFPNEFAETVRQIYTEPTYVADVQKIQAHRERLGLPALPDEAPMESMVAQSVWCDGEWWNIGPALTYYADDGRKMTVATYMAKTYQSS